MKKGEWYKAWFDSPYYHFLYKHRNDDEAKFLIDNLMPILSLPQGAKVLDFACGRGRHSVYLNTKGFQVVGIDLSEASINFAKVFENELLKFDVHNIQNPYSLNEFDAVFNLFTSFGYNDHDDENFKTIESACASLKKDGYFVLDYLNEGNVRNTILECQQSIFIDTTEFLIHRELTENFINKTIEVVDKDQRFFFTERVKFYSSDELISGFKQSNLEVVGLYGDYHFGDYHKETSPRLILIGKK